MNKTEALKMAIEAMDMDNDCECGRSNEVVSALINALEACKEALKNLEKDPPISRNEQPAQDSEQAPCEQPVALHTSSNPFNSERHGLEVLRNAHPAPQPAQEPVAIIKVLWSIIDDIDTYSDIAKSNDKQYRKWVEKRQKDRWNTGITTDGYTLNIPPHPTPSWQGLSDDEITKVFDGIGVSTTHRKIYRAIEQALKEKNT